MKLYALASELLSQQPLPDDAPEQLQALIDQSKGAERMFIIHASSALHSGATPEQIKLWSKDK